MSNNQVVVVSYGHGRMTTASQSGLKPPVRIGLSAEDQAPSVIPVSKLLQPDLEVLRISFTRFHRSTFEGLKMIELEYAKSIVQSLDHNLRLTR